MVDLVGKGYDLERQPDALFSQRPPKVQQLCHCLRCDGLRKESHHLWDQPGRATLREPPATLSKAQRSQSHPPAEDRGLLPRISETIFQNWNMEAKMHVVPRHKDHKAVLPEDSQIDPESCEIASYLGYFADFQPIYFQERVYTFCRW